jgi:hypothetical protein
MPGADHVEFLDEAGTWVSVDQAGRIVGFLVEEEDWQEADGWDADGQVRKFL